MSLPENAYRELRPGEAYEPLVPATSPVPEVTRRSIVFGLVMTTIFSAAAAYISLKLGQGIESAIPIAILAIGIAASIVLARLIRSLLFGVGPGDWPSHLLAVAALLVVALVASLIPAIRASRVDPMLVLKGD